MNDKAKKPQKLRARLPRGLADRGAAELAATRAMTETIRGVFERYGFDPVETPAFEYTDALGKFLPDQDRPNEGVFSFQDDDAQWISLRYDLTAPLARYVAENYQHLAMPYRSYRAGYVYRNEKPGPGRFRQFMQFDADTVGSASPAADAEMCMMAADAMEALGFSRGQYVVKVNSRKVLDGVMESIGVTSELQKLTILRAIDKADKFPLEEIKKLLGAGRKDESGDFTRGAGLSPEDTWSVLQFVQSGVGDRDEIAQRLKDAISASGRSPPTAQDKSDEYARYVWSFIKQPIYSSAEHAGVDDRVIEIPVTDKFTFKLAMINDDLLRSLRSLSVNGDTYKQGLEELNQIAAIAVGAGYGSNRIRIDPSVVRGLEYYTGAVFEVELLLDTKDEKGRPVRFGSVGGGGRYDGLVSRFMGQPVPATGFSIGVSRLQAALELLNKDKPQPVIHGPVVVTVLDKDRIADYQKLVKTLRDAPVDPDKPAGPRIRAELYLGSPKNMGNQLKYADKRNSPCVIIQGSNELNHESGEPHLIVKNLIVGNEVALFHAVTESELSSQDFKSDQKAQSQQLIPVSEMVDAVRALLAKHGVDWN